MNAGELSSEPELHLDARSGHEKATFGSGDWDEPEISKRQDVDDPEEAEDAFFGDESE